jgi:hypothetical protein
MAELNNICKECFHSYVCERFNANRDGDNENCLYAHDHFVPAADVAEVVRCKDCKYYKQNPYGEDGQKMCQCWIDWLSTDNNDFCSYGERKEK